MRKGLVILRPPTSTLELRAQVSAAMASKGWSCEQRTRFDGVYAVSLQIPEELPESSIDELEALLRSEPLLAAAALELKAFD